jgi:hypothetical protein
MEMFLIKLWKYFKLIKIKELNIILIVKNVIKILLLLIKLKYNLNKVIHIELDV